MKKFIIVLLASFAFCSAATQANNYLLDLPISPKYLELLPAYADQNRWLGGVVGARPYFAGRADALDATELMAAGSKPLTRKEMIEYLKGLAEGALQMKEVLENGYDIEVNRSVDN